MARARLALAILLTASFGSGLWWFLRPAPRVAARPSELVAPDVAYYEEHADEASRPWGLVRTPRGETRFRPARAEEPGIGGYVLEGDDSEIRAAAILRAGEPGIPSLAADLDWRRVADEPHRFVVNPRASREVFLAWWNQAARPDSAAQELLAPLRELVCASDRIVGAVRGGNIVGILLPETAPAALLFAEANLATFPFEEMLPPGDAIFGASYRTDDAGRWGASFASDASSVASLFTEGPPGEIARVLRRGTSFAMARHDLGSETALSRLGAILRTTNDASREGWPLRAFASGTGRGVLVDLGGGALLTISAPTGGALDSALDEVLDPSGARRLTVHSDYPAFRKLLPPKFAAILAWRENDAPETQCLSRAVGFTGPEGNEREATFFIVTRTFTP